jgi:hypothetical protein
MLRINGRFILILAYFAIVVSPVTVSSQSQTDSLVFTSPELSYNSPFYKSDGFLVTLTDSSIIHVFRQDSVEINQHAGNNGKIVCRTSHDHGLTWSAIRLIWDEDSIDDRNIHGGLIGRDSIFITFRKYDAENYQQINVFLMYSFDGGTTFTQPVVLPTTASSSGTGGICRIPDRGFYMPFYKTDYVELRFSPDGFDWDSIAHTWNYQPPALFKITESAFTWCGDGRIVALFRNERKTIGETMLMSFSEDFGYSWSGLTSTNLADGFYCPAPWSFYDSTRNEFWVIVGDRRDEMELLDTTHLAVDESIWIYRNNPDEIVNNPLSFGLVHRFQRPVPSSYRFYGYPYSTFTAKGDVLVIFTENELCSNPTKGECPDFYQFFIRHTTGVGTGPENEANHFNVTAWPNPAETEIALAGKSPGLSCITVRIFDSSGRCIANSQVQPNPDKTFSRIINTENQKPGLYLIRFHQDEWSGSLKIILK